MIRPPLFALLVAMCFLSAAPFPVRAAEKLIGQSCSGDQNAVDWDTLAQFNGSTFQKSGSLTSLNAPTATTDVANKAYVDAKAGGLAWHQQVFTGNGTWTWSSGN